MDQMFTHRCHERCVYHTPLLPPLMSPFVVIVAMHSTHRCHERCVVVVDCIHHALHHHDALAAKQRGGDDGGEVQVGAQLQVG